MHLDNLLKRIQQHLAELESAQHANFTPQASKEPVTHAECRNANDNPMSLNQAITDGEQALAATPHDHPDRATMLNNLGLAYHSRFVRGGVSADLDRAIELSEQALAAAPHDHPDRATRLNNLGAVYHSRFVRGGVSADLDRAIELSEQALAAAPHDHPDRATRLNNLGAAYRRRFVRGGVSADLDRAIELSEQALAATPHDHPDRATVLGHLCYAYLLRVYGGGGGVDGASLHALADQVDTTTPAFPQHLVMARYLAGRLAMATAEYSVGIKLLDAAVAFLPSMVPRESGWADQEHNLVSVFGLVEDAIAAHCAVYDSASAVEIAEMGRGILLGAQLDARTDLTDLDHTLPELATRFRHLRDLLNVPEPLPGGLPGNTARRIDDRRRLWIEHDLLLKQIRHHRQFTRFLLPPRLADIQSASRGGTVILVNTSTLRSDAITITAEGEPVQIRLPNLNETDVDSYAATMLDITQETPDRLHTSQGQGVLAEILGWLWDTVVAPVLNTYLPVANGRAKPRVWWLPTGRLGLFPLHAAGHLGRPGALDRVVSSYTATLRTLAHIRTRPLANTRHQLTVALEHTPGLPDLPGTVAEAADLHAYYPDARLLANHRATTSETTAALHDATWAHFACHASADFETPSRGGLRLHDGTLSIPEIARLQLPHAELAYLSACSTANRGTKHGDECINLASAFQLAGFRHVIATLWPLNDQIAATAAHAFYQYLPAHHATSSTAFALHRVTHELRDRYPNHPNLWAPLIHTGP